MDKIDVVIIGGGIAGLTAAIYAKRANCSVLVIEKNYCGGQIVPLKQIGNYPGFEGINGFDLAEKVINQAQKLGVDIIFTKLESIKLDASPKLVKTEKGEIKAISVIIANGTIRKPLGVKGEIKFTGRGVSYCAACDGNIYKGKEVAIAGSSFNTIEESLYLSNICSQVYLINPKGDFEEDEVVEILKKENITIVQGKPKEVGGDKNVEYLDIELDEKITRLNISALFVANGTDSDNSFYAPCKIDENGFFIAGEDCRTNVKGVFAAGDTRTKDLRQVVTAAADGANAGVNASLYAKKNR